MLDVCLNISRLAKMACMLQTELLVVMVCTVMPLSLMWTVCLTLRRESTGFLVAFCLGSLQLCYYEREFRRVQLVMGLE